MKVYLFSHTMVLIYRVHIGGRYSHNGPNIQSTHLGSDTHTMGLIYRVHIWADTQNFLRIPYLMVIEFSTIGGPKLGIHGQGRHI